MHGSRQAAAERSWLRHDRNFDGLRRDPEYQRVLEGVRDRWKRCGAFAGGT